MALWPGAARRMHKIVEVREISAQGRARRGKRMTGNDGTLVNGLGEACERREIVDSAALDEKGDGAHAEHEVAVHPGPPKHRYR